MTMLHLWVRTSLGAKWAACSGTWNLNLSYKAVISSGRGDRWFPYLGRQALMPCYLILRNREVRPPNPTAWTGLGSRSGGLPCLLLKISQGLRLARSSHNS